jgi:hypothetical protein
VALKIQPQMDIHWFVSPRCSTRRPEERTPPGQEPARRREGYRIIA